MQDERWAAGWYEPGEQAEQLPHPDWANAPGAQDWHSVLASAAEYFPSAHAMQADADVCACWSL